MKKLWTLLTVIPLAVPVSAQQWVSDRLEKSPRHQEWVETRNGDRTVHSFITYPEVNEKVPVVIVIHENRGLNDWARSVTDQLAEDGYIAIAPDLLSGMAPGGGNTADFASEDRAREAIYALDPDQVTSDLNTVFEYARKIPAGNGKVIVAGFCWGGGQSFRYAVNQQELAAALVFYGSGIKEAAEAEQIGAPVFGFYGGDDQRVNATIPASEEAMKAAGKTYKPVVYDGAGHGFYRAGEDPEASEANKKARQEAHKRLLEILEDI